MKHTKYRWVVLLLLMLCLSVCAGCSIVEEAGEARGEPDYTVVAKEDIPPELAAQIEAGCMQEMKLIYADSGVLYLVRGYGEQPAGSSIQVLELYQAADGIHLDTQLSGGGNPANTQTTRAYPYIVVKLLSDEQNVVFE